MVDEASFKPDFDRELVENVEVHVKLWENYGTKGFLLGHVYSFIVIHMMEFLRAFAMKK
jgi:hypothetical protein